MNNGTSPELPGRRSRFPRFYQPSERIDLSELLYDRPLLKYCFIISLFINFSIYGVLEYNYWIKHAGDQAMDIMQVHLIVKKEKEEEKAFQATSGFVSYQKSDPEIIRNILSKLAHPDSGMIGTMDKIIKGDMKIKFPDLYSINDVLKDGDLDERSLMDKEGSLTALDLSLKKEPEIKIDLKDELITMEDLDIGRYKGLIFPDPKDREKVKGIIYIKNLIGERFGNRRSRAATNIRDNMRKWTKIRANVGRAAYMSNQSLKEDPFLFLSHSGVIEILPPEAKGLRRCLDNGGFVVFQAGGDAGQKVGFRNSLLDSLGRGYDFVALRTSHFIFHSFFDYEGYEEDYIVSMDEIVPRKLSGGKGAITSYDGIFIDDRLVGLFSWAGIEERMMVNIVVASMLRKYSLAWKNTRKYGSQ